MNDDENRPESLDDRAARVLGALGDGEEGEQAEDADEPVTVSGDAAGTRCRCSRRNQRSPISGPRRVFLCQRVS